MKGRGVVPWLPHTKVIKSHQQPLGAVLYLLDCQEGRCESLQLYAGFSMEKPTTLERINAWNWEHRFSRAYLDADGDPALEADLDLSGEVAEGAIRAFLDLFEKSLRAFAAWIGFD
uniref:YbjN domain-containing protein n=1 Tax=Thermus islandicus TaxID=540988 RepID=A0A831XFY5_9DEIN